jgi:IS30 family transposase
MPEHENVRTRPKFQQLSQSERGIIQAMLKKKVRARIIAYTLGKDRSTIYREIRRNTDAGGLYIENHASAILKRRRVAARAKFRIIENDCFLQGQVEQLLQFGLSPDQIAGFQDCTRQHARVSRSTVYRWVHRAWQGRKSLLRFRGKTRAPYGSRKNSWDADKRHISTRPTIVEKRERVGDWEADLVHGIKDDSHHSLLTLNDRATGFCIIRKMSALDSNTVAQAIIDALSGLPVRTITCDNGFEFGRHKKIERMLKCKVYFTDTNSPQQRGSNENLNGLLRQFFPKGRSMRHVTQSQATDAARRLNGRPRKRFGYEAPRRMFAAMTGRSGLFIR